MDTAIEWGKKLEGVLEYYEDPVRGQAAISLAMRLLGICLPGGAA